jgi:thiol-disulfide isomerase/thioredoxin
MKLNIILLLALVLLSGVVSDSKAPNFELKNLRNKDVELYKVLTSGPVLLDFWATWCKPCQKAFPKLNELHRKYGDRGLTILGINEDGNRSQAKIKPFVKSMNLQFEVLIDGNNDIMRKFQVTNLPATVLISPQGQVISSNFGYSADKFTKLEAEINLLLQETNSPDSEQSAKN